MSISYNLLIFETQYDKISFGAKKAYPGVAQLVARLTGGQEAASSSLVTRTTASRTSYRSRRHFFLFVKMASAHSLRRSAFSPQNRRCALGFAGTPLTRINAAIYLLKLCQSEYLYRILRFFYFLANVNFEIYQRNLRDKLVLHFKTVSEHIVLRLFAFYSRHRSLARTCPL